MTNISQYTAVHVEYPQPSSKSHQEDEQANALPVTSLITATPYSYQENDQQPDWFDMNQIHTIERQALPEYFNGTLSPEEYKHCRDEMIKTYRAHPDYYLTVSACKSKLDRDLVELVRIHSFLELNQLINCQWDPRRRIFDPSIDTEPYAQVKPHSQRNFREVEEASIEHLRSLIYSESHVPKRPSLWNMSDQEDDTLNPDSRKVFHCCNCQADCSEVRYQSLKTKGFQVCIDCFLEGRFPAIYGSSDFLRMEGLADLNMDEEWTDEEILRLLEGVDRFEDDWLMISEHVGSRSKEQCVTQFLQLPINDEFLKAKLTTKERESLPFSKQPNPVMTTIAFLAGHVNPGVGAAAAKTALKELVKSGEGREDLEDIKIEEEEQKGIEVKEKEAQFAFSEETLKKAQIAAIKSAVENAHKLASYEDQEIQHWTRLAVKTMVDKLSFKVQQYDELENSLVTELQELEKQQGVLATSIETLSSQRFPLHPDPMMIDSNPN
ncbi:SWIRM domain-containing protein [Choanephora cucurbitarum]|nr:SWIRM domain-containing protein [Choanephora cucurbitarum]